MFSLKEMHHRFRCRKPLHFFKTRVAFSFYLFYFVTFILNCHNEIFHIFENRLELEPTQDCITINLIQTHYGVIWRSLATRDLTEIFPKLPIRGLLRKYLEQAKLKMVHPIRLQIRKFKSFPSKNYLVAFLNNSFSCH